MSDQIVCVARATAVVRAARCSPAPSPGLVSVGVASTADEPYIAVLVAAPHGPSVTAKLAPRDLVRLVAGLELASRRAFSRSINDVVGEAFAALEGAREDVAKMAQDAPRGPRDGQYRPGEPWQRNKLTSPPEGDWGAA